MVKKKHLMQIKWDDGEYAQVIRLADIPFNGHHKGQTLNAKIINRWIRVLIDGQLCKCDACY